MVAISGVAVAQSTPKDSAAKAKKEERGNSGGNSGYAMVDGLRMYYEVHGTGQPLLLLHGAFMTIESNWATILPALAKSHKVIAVEVQGHGHTADVDRPLSHPQMVEDVAGLLRQLHINDADVLGYSMGGPTALGLAIKHPDLVRKVVAVSTAANRNGWDPKVLQAIASLPADFAPPSLKSAYDKVAPDPKHWPTLVAKVKQSTASFEGWSEKDLKAIKAPTLIVMGDRDGFPLERAVALSHTIPNCQLAVLPGTDHLMIVSTRADLLVSLVDGFL